MSANRRARWRFCRTAPARGRACCAGLDPGLRVGSRPVAARSSFSSSSGSSTRVRLSFTASSSSDESLSRVAALGATLVTCPRSNQWVGVGVPPIARFYAAGVPVAVGTDSLASVADLNLFSELKTMRWLAPEVPARTLLESATLVGARALGFRRSAWIDRRGQARGVDCGRIAGRRRGCGRVSGERDRAAADALGERAWAGKGACPIRDNR